MSSEQEELLRRFRSCQLEASEWTHRAHLRVAIATLRTDSPEIALADLRRDIQRLNLSHGVVTTAERGYHETLTRFWLWRVWASLEEAGREASESLLLELAGGPGEPLRYYSRSRLFSWEARIGWLEPDLAPLAPDPGRWSDGTPPLFSLTPARE